MPVTNLIYQTLKFGFKILPFKKQFCLVLKNSGIKLPKRIYRELAFDGSFNTSIYGINFKLKNYKFTHHIIENDIFWLQEKAWEPTTIKLWIYLVRKSNTIFDVGANTGIFSIVAAAANKNSKIYSFEPIPRTFSWFQKNISANNFTTITAEQMALSDKDGYADIFDMGDDLPLNASLSSTYHQDEPKRVAIKVKTARLDTYIKNHQLQNIDAMKMDVETFEYYVLLGMGEFLKSFSVPMILEIFGQAQWDRVYPILKDVYAIFYIDEDTSKLREVDSYANIRLYNFLLLPKTTESSSVISLAQLKTDLPDLF